MYTLYSQRVGGLSQVGPPTKRSSEKVGIFICFFRKREPQVSNMGPRLQIGDGSSAQQFPRLLLLFLKQNTAYTQGRR